MCSSPCPGGFRIKIPGRNSWNKGLKNEGFQANCLYSFYHAERCKNGSRARFRTAQMQAIFSAADLPLMPLRRKSVRPFVLLSASWLHPPLVRLSPAKVRAIFERKRTMLANTRIPAPLGFENRPGRDTLDSPWDEGMAPGGIHDDKGVSAPFPKGGGALSSSRPKVL